MFTVIPTLELMAGFDNLFSICVVNLCGCRATTTKLTFVVLDHWMKATNTCEFL